MLYIILDCIILYLFEPPLEVLGPTVPSRDTQWFNCSGRRIDFGLRTLFGQEIGQPSGGTTCQTLLVSRGCSSKVVILDATKNT